MESQASTDLLIDKFRLALDNVEAVRRLNTRIEQTEDKIELLNKALLSRPYTINESTETENGTIKNNKIEIDVKVPVVPSSPVVYSASPIRKGLVDESTILQKIEKIERDLARQQDTNTGNINRVVFENKESKKLLTAVIEQNKRLQTDNADLHKSLLKLEEESEHTRSLSEKSLLSQPIIPNTTINNLNLEVKEIVQKNELLIKSNTELNETVNDMRNELLLLKSKLDLLTNHTESILGPVAEHEGNESTNLVEDMQDQLISMQNQILTQNVKVDSFTKHFNVSNANIEKVVEDVKFVKGEVISLHNAKYYHYLHDAEPELVMQDTIISLNKHWKDFEVEFEYGVNQLLNRKGGTMNDPFVLSTTKLLKETKHILSILNLNSYESDEAIKDNDYGSAQLYEKLFPLLNNVVIMSRELLQIDDGSKVGETETLYTFQDIQSSGGARDLRDRLIRISDITKSALDIKIDKVEILQRLEHIDNFMKTAVSRAELNDLLDKIKNTLTEKADLKVVEDITSTKASIKELRKLKDKILSGDINSLNQNSIEDFNNNNNHMNVANKFIDNKSDEDIEKMLKKFDALSKEFYELKSYTKIFVPRDEVNEAMQSILQELKTVKVNSVSLTNFNMGMKSKADDTQVQRLISALRGAMGNLEARSSAVGYLRCLLCDKPVNTVTSSPFDDMGTDGRRRSFSAGNNLSNQGLITPPRSRPRTAEARLLTTDSVKALSALEENDRENTSVESHENKGKEKARMTSNKYSAARSPKTMSKLSEFDDELSSVNSERNEINSLRVALSLPGMNIHTSHGANKKETPSSLEPLPVNPVARIHQVVSERLRTSHSGGGTSRGGSRPNSTTNTNNRRIKNQ